MILGLIRETVLQTMMAGRRFKFQSQMRRTRVSALHTFAVYRAGLDAEINRAPMIFQNGFAPTRLCVCPPGVSAFVPFPMKVSLGDGNVAPAKQPS